MARTGQHPWLPAMLVHHLSPSCQCDDNNAYNLNTFKCSRWSLIINKMKYQGALLEQLSSWITTITTWTVIMVAKSQNLTVNYFFFILAIKQFYSRPSAHSRSSLATAYATGKFIFTIFNINTHFEWIQLRFLGFLTAQRCPGWMGYPASFVDVATPMP